MTTKSRWECEDVTDENDFLEAPVRLWLRRWSYYDPQYINDSDYYIVEYKDEPDRFYMRYSVMQDSGVTYEKHECIAGPFDELYDAMTAAEMLTCMEVEP